MAWLRIDTGFARHRKVCRLSYPDRWRHLEAMAWCAEMGTDGVVMAADLHAIWSLNGLRDGRRLVARMVAEGLWDCLPDDRDGWLIHDWRVYNVGAENAKAMRDAAAERKRRWREKRSGVLRDGTQDKTRDETRTSPSRVRPDPTPSSKEEGRGEGTGKEKESAAPEPEPSPLAQSPAPEVEVNGNGTGSVPLTEDGNIDLDAFAEEAPPVVRIAIQRARARILDEGKP